MAKAKIVYTVTRTGGKNAFKGTTFKSYEAARSAVRRTIRNMKTYTPTGTNPAIGDFGYSISRS